MKQFLLILIANLFLSNFLFAQAPDKMSYQAIVRNSNNVVVSNHAIGMRISILQGSATGKSVYTETQTPTTNANGLIAIEIGTGTKINGNFSNIDWANGPYFVKTETDPNGGSNYTLIGTSQLLSVPYALHSKTSLKTDTAKVAQYALNALNGVPLGSQHGQMLTNCDGNLTWTFNGQCPAKIAAFNCVDTVHSGIITSIFPANNCSSSVSYSGGNGGIYSAQSIASIGVTGLTATLAAGTLNSGNGTLPLTISGTPTSAGIASFVLQIGNQTCVIMRSVVTASISNFNCADTVHTGIITSNFPVSNCSSSVSYSGGNAANYLAQTIASTGVTGLTASLDAGTLNLGNGTLTINITGTPSSSGIAYFKLQIGNQFCVIKRPIITASISNFNCSDTVHIGTFFNTILISGASSTISYSGGNSGMYAAQTIASTGVTGLTATLAEGTLNSGEGTFTFNISGTPASAGIASFNITFGNKSCQLQRLVNVLPPQPNWSNGTVFCKGSPTLVIEVTNPLTGKTWMDRNLGAERAAISSVDTLAYGDFYQWGRAADGHQCRYSSLISILSSTDQPNQPNFILASNSPYDWRNTQNDNLWQGVNGVNNPCPSGYRLPTNTELDVERSSWSQNNSTGAIYSVLKQTLSGSRYFVDGSLLNIGTSGYYWSSTVIGNRSWSLGINSGNAFMSDDTRSSSFSIRCIKDYSATVGSIDTIGSINIGNMYAGTVAHNINTSLNYTNGNGAFYDSQTISSSGVSGLTAILVAGILNNGNGTLTFNISGTPNSNGIASFNILIGGKTCVFKRYVNLPIGTYRAGTIHCNGTPTLVIEVTNPVTGKTWMDRNLGASQAATSSTDTSAFGDLYQWGRGADGHQCRNSATTTTLSTTDQPGHGNLISGPYDWRSPQNDSLWQGMNGINNPCPFGYRIPSYNELNAEKTSWALNNNIGAFNSTLKLPLTTDNLFCWSSSTSNGPQSLSFYLEIPPFPWMSAFIYGPRFFNRVSKMPVRCIKDV